MVSTPHINNAICTGQYHDIKFWVLPKSDSILFFCSSFKHFAVTSFALERKHGKRVNTIKS